MTGKPWYTEHETWIARVDAYLHAFGRLPLDHPAVAEIRSFGQLQSMRLVFESGPACFRPELHVYCHEWALRMAVMSVVEFSYALHATKLKMKIAESSDAHLTEEQRLSLKTLDELPPLEEAYPFTEAKLKQLHKALAEGLLPKEARVAAGEYRVDSRAAGLSTVFLAPERIPGAMRDFVERAVHLGASRAHPIVYAATLSHAITWIHPFPDFNGRLSRLVLWIALMIRGIPFPISLRFKSKNKARYKSALIRADHDDIEPYATLIARTLVESFETLERNLVAVGLPRLLGG
jgi:fido (protein-threonine AMPylation protein)